MNNKRLFAGAIDFFISAIIQSILMFIFMIRPFISQQIEMNQLSYLNLKITFISMLYLILRDIPGSGSLGKKILKLKIVDTKTDSNAILTKRVLRNITWFLGPVEIIVLLVSGKRIGDILAKTKIVTDTKS